MKKKFNLIEANEEKIKELKEGSAFTFEGLKADDESLAQLVSDLVKETQMKVCPTIYTWKGELFNSIYGLTGNNRYPEDLTFVSLALDNWDNKDIPTLSIFKFKVGARWLDDIVDNNAVREGNYEDEEAY